MTDYTQHDYQELVDRITELLQDKPGFTDSYESSTSQVLIQLLADSTDHLFYMLERRAQESFLDTARLDTSIWARASEIGYRPRRRVSSTGTVQLSIVDDDENLVTSGGNIFISKGTALTSEGENFVTTEDVTIQEGQSSVSIPVKEGILRSEQYDFNLPQYANDPSFTIDKYQIVENFSLSITDGDGEYKDVGSQENQRLNITSLSYAMPDCMLYDLRFTRDGMRIFFGDNEFGRRPSGILNVEWIESKGGDVSFLTTGLDFTIGDTEFLTDDQNITPQRLYNYSITNTTPIRGGQDEEGVRAIARNAPEFARTANRAVTSQDHEFWILNSGIGDIVDVRAYAEQDTDSLIYGMNNVDISYITGDQLPLNVEQLQQLREFMDRYKMVTTHLIFNQVDKLEMVLDIDFKRDSQLPIANTQLYEVVKQRVESYFEIERGSIGSEFQHSEFIKYLQSQSFRFNGINYPIADWVKVQAVVQYPITAPVPSYDVLVDIDPSYTYNVGDTFTIVIDGVSYSVQVEAEDTEVSLFERMRIAIFEDTNFLTSIEDDDFLRIKSPFVDSVFIIDVTQGDLGTFTSTDNIFQIPPSTLYNPGNNELLKEGSVQIVDQDEEVLFQDDGLGKMQPVNSNQPAFGVDYVNCTLLSPTMATGDYFIRFQQNDFQNFDTNLRSAIVLSDLAPSINDPFLYSKLKILQ